MTALKRRLDKLEEKLNTNSKYRGCELEIHPGVDDEPTQYYCRYPDGHREMITDSDIVSELEAIDDSISVEVID